jgi:hypothetical protein
MYNTIIKDPEIEPYYILKDQTCYVVVEKYFSDPNNIRGKKPLKGNENVEKERKHTFHTTIKDALKSICRLKTGRGEEYNSIKEYIKEYEGLEVKINKIYKNI